MTNSREPSSPASPTKQGGDVNGEMLAEMLAALNSIRIWMKNHDRSTHEQKIYDALRLVIAKAEARTHASGGTQAQAGEGWPREAIERLVERLETLADHGAATMADAQEVAADAWSAIRALLPAAPVIAEPIKPLDHEQTR